MATLTIRQLDDGTHARLRERAARHGRSVEAEVRAILDATTGRPDVNVLVSLHRAFAPDGGIELELDGRTHAPRDVELA